MLHPNVVIVRNVDPNGCARTRKCNYIKVCEVGFWKSVFLEVWGPRQLFNQTFGLIHQCVEFGACFFINDWDESFELCSCSGGIQISFDEADVCFNNGTNVFNPVALRVFMLIHTNKIWLNCQALLTFQIRSVRCSFGPSTFDFHWQQTQVHSSYVKQRPPWSCRSLRRSLQFSLLGARKNLGKVGLRSS